MATHIEEAGIDHLVLDNCRAHFDPMIRVILNAHNIRLVYLPPYRLTKTMTRTRVSAKSESNKNAKQ